MCDATTNAQCQADRKRVGFTLVELLVVIGIIALLISMLLPVLSKARNQATNVACLANLRTLGQSCLMYADANKGVMLATYADTAPGHVANDGAWFTLLAPYLTHDIDPANASQRTTYVYYRCPTGWASQQYGNKPLYSWDGLDYALMDYSVTGTPLGWKKMASLRPGNQWVSFFDYDYHQSDGTDDSGSIYTTKFQTCVQDSFRYTLMYRHRSNGTVGINAVFIDGHAEFVPTLATNGVVPNSTQSKQMFANLRNAGLGPLQFTP